MSIYGTITDYMGAAYTGAGIVHRYDDLIDAAKQTIFIKCPPTRAIQPFLNDVASHYVKRGLDIDRFLQPVHPDQTAALWIHELELVIIQASFPVALEPVLLGGQHHVVSLYEAFDVQQLANEQLQLEKLWVEGKHARTKSLQALAEALQIHDQWEAINIKRMMWEEHQQLIESLKEELFGTMQLHKRSTVKHRLVGSLSAGGAHDFIPSISKRVNRRLLIKGVAGSGKSTLMRALGEEAEKRGVDVLYGWCGLDPSSVDLIIFPELSICLFDATKPHAYEVEKKGDEILDLHAMCSEDEVADQKITVYQQQYKEKILDAAGYMHAFAQADLALKKKMDQTVQQVKLEKYFQQIWDQLPS